MWNGADLWQAGQGRVTRCVQAGVGRQVGGNLEIHHTPGTWRGSPKSGYGVLLNGAQVARVYLKYMYFQN